MSSRDKIKNLSQSSVSTSLMKIVKLMIC